MNKLVTGTFKAESREPSVDDRGSADTTLLLLEWCEVDHRRVQTRLAINRELKAGRPITSATTASPVVATAC